MGLLKYSLSNGTKSHKISGLGFALTVALAVLAASPSQGSVFKVLSYEMGIGESCENQAVSPKRPSLYEGSGFKISSEFLGLQSANSQTNYIVTAAHVIGIGHSLCIGVETLSGQFIAGRLLFSDFPHDLALISVDSHELAGIKTIPVAKSSELKKNDSVSLVGMPKGSSKVYIYKNEFLRQLDQTLSLRNLAMMEFKSQSNMPALSEYGMSGGAVLNQVGELVGMLVSHHISTNEKDDLVETSISTFAIPIEQVVEKLKGFIQYPNNVLNLKLIPNGQIFLGLGNLKLTGSEIDEDLLGDIGGARGSGIGGARGSGIGGDGNSEIAPAKAIQISVGSTSDAENTPTEYVSFVDSYKKTFIPGESYIVKSFRCSLQSGIGIKSLRFFLHLVKDSTCSFEFESIPRRSRLAEMSIGEIFEKRETVRNTQELIRGKILEGLSSVPDDKILEDVKKLDLRDQIVYFHLVQDYVNRPTFALKFSSFLNKNLEAFRLSGTSTFENYCSWSGMNSLNFQLLKILNHDSDVLGQGSLFQKLSRRTDVSAALLAFAMTSSLNVGTTICRAEESPAFLGSQIEVLEVESDCEVATASKGVLFRIREIEGQTGSIDTLVVIENGSDKAPERSFDQCVVKSIKRLPISFELAESMQEDFSVSNLRYVNISELTRLDQQLEYYRQLSAALLSIESALLRRATSPQN
ncbi:MAG: serine protease [Proteobacteria bacterium]|nr:serine protease [Pseudomonadota bacterium]